MAVNLSPVGGVAAQFFTSTGAVLTGGKLYTYAAGTTTPAVTYTNSQGNVAWTNPIVLDAAGRVSGSGEIWLTDGIIYKFVLKDSNDVLIATYDNITGINSNAVAYTNAQEIITATAGQTVFALTISYQPGTNSLSVFVDGVNQYGPGAQYSYVETDSTTVTFNSGLHVGAEVKFTTTQQQGAGAVDASQVSYDPPFTGSVTTNVEAKLAQTVSVIDFGAVGDGVSDDTAAIQAAIDYIHSVGGGGVYVPGGQYIASQIKLKTRVALFGGGWGSRLTLKDNTDDHFIVLDDVDVEWTQLSNLMVDGNRFNNTAGNAIHYDNTGGSFTFFDANHIIENILIYTAANAGLSLSVDSRESKVVNVFCTGANGDGFYISATDSTFVNCTSGAAGLNGWNILGPNNRITGCKAFGSARLVTAGAFDGAGFRIAQPRQMLSACEAQDNGWHGFLFVDANNCSASSLVADSNGSNTSGSAGIRLDNSDECVIQGATLNRDSGTDQDYALSFGNSPANNVINITSLDNASGAFIDAVGNNIVIINNAQVLSSAAPTLTTNKSLAWQLTSDTQLTIAVRGSDGTTRTVTLTLS